MIKVDRRSALAGAGITTVVLIAGLLIAGTAQAFSWPWQKAKPEITRVVKGTIVCSSVTNGFGGSASSLSITVNGTTSTVNYPTQVDDKVQIFSSPRYAHYRQEVTIPKNSDGVTLSYDMQCRDRDGKVVAGNKDSFEVKRDNNDLDRTICISSLRPCTGPEWTERLGCAAVVLVAGPGGVAALDLLHQALTNEPDAKQLYNDMKSAASKRSPLSGALACFNRTVADQVPLPPVATPIPTIAPVPVVPIPTIAVVPPASAAPPKPTLANFAATVQGPGQVQVTFNVGWQGGRDPVTCHFYIDGAESFAAVCGTSSSKTFTGIAPGTHQFAARVTDKEGIASDWSPTLSRDVPGAPPPSPSVTVSRGTPCGGGGGSACAGGTCSSTSCGYIHVTTANFSGNVSCTFNSQQGSVGWLQNRAWGPNESKDSPNWFGYHNNWVSVTCNGVTGTFTWP
jgi:hypothetical protein